MPGGRPLKFKSPKELEEKIEAYFASCVSPLLDEKGNHLTDKNNNPLYRQVRPYTITGLAVALDCDRDTLLNYEKKEEFFGTIKAAKSRIHNYTEEYLFTGKNQTGAIFNLKNNWGWKDKQDFDHTTGGEKITPIIPLDVLNRKDEE